MYRLLITSKDDIPFTNGSGKTLSISDAYEVDSVDQANKIANGYLTKYPSRSFEIYFDGTRYNVQPNTKKIVMEYFEV